MSASTGSGSCRSPRCCMRWRARPPRRCARPARPRARSLETRRNPRHGSGRDPHHLLQPGGVRPHREGLGAAVRSRRVPRGKAAGAADRCRDRRGCGRRRSQADRPPGAQDCRKHQGSADRPRRFAGPLRRRGSGQPGNRRDLCRGRRGTDRGEARRAGRCRRHQAADAGYRPVLWSVDPQHAGGGQELQPRRRADRHLPRHAPGRAADAGNRRGAVPRVVLRSRPLRFVGGGPGEDEHAAGHHQRHGVRYRAHPAQGRPAAHGEDAVRVEGRPRPDRRHRQSRQSPGALGRRVDGEPVPRRIAAHGARHS